MKHRTSTRETPVTLESVAHLRPLLQACFLSAVALLFFIPAPLVQAQCTFGGESIISSTADGAYAVYAVDIDLDGDIDVLSAAYLDGVAWHENDGALLPTFTTHTITTTAQGARSVFAADVDGDGDIDVLSATEFEDTIAWFKNDGMNPPNFSPAQIISDTADQVSSVYAADMDDDGDIDVLSASAAADRIDWYENDGSDPPIFTAHTIAFNEDGAHSVFAADVDGDGDTDVFSAIRRENTVVWYENDGASDPVFSAHTIATGVSRPRVVIGADVDGDGDTDAVCASYADDTIAWYENDGALPPAWTAHTISNTADGAFSVAAADMDGDGDTDLLSASNFDDKIAWYENDGGGLPTFITHVITTNADGANSVFAADLDGDGDPDALSASVLDDTIAWYEELAVPPTAVAGTDQAIHAGDTVDLDGSASFDDNTASALLGYSWSFDSKPAGSSATLTDANTATPSFDADAVGTYVLALVVSDDCGHSEPDLVTISSNNMAPTAVATADFSLAIVGVELGFDGSLSSDPDDDALTYSWIIIVAPLGSTATLMGAATASPTLTTDLEGTYAVELTVSDFIGSGEPDTVSIVATTATAFAEVQILAACDQVEALLPHQVTTAGNQIAFCNFLAQAMTKIQQGKLDKAIERLNHALERTDGCFFSGTPDGNGPGRDWIIDCAAQLSTYALLTSAVNALES